MDFNLVALNMAHTVGYARVAFYCYLLIKLVTGYVPFSSKLVEMLTEGG